MRNTKKLLAFALAALMLAGTLAGCTPKTPAESPIPSESAPPVVEPTTFDLAVNLASEPQTIDPALNSAVDGAIMLNHFFEGLIRWIDDGAGNATLDSGQAESYDKTVNDDGTVTYTFKLRSDAKWSDGQAVTANDFVYAWQRLATPATAADYTYMIDMVKGYNEVFYGTPTGQFEDVTDEETGEVSQAEVMDYADPSTLAVSAPDDGTFVVTLTYDCPYFIEVCAFPAAFPVRKDVIDAAGDQWTFDVATYIGNGPYKMSEWTHNSYIKAIKNENYYEYDKLGPDSITFQLMDDANAILSAFNSGTLQFIEEVPTDEIATLLAGGELHIVDYLGTYYASFNVEKAPFDDPRVREAFSLVIDRNYIVENVTQTGQLPATGYVPSGTYDADGPSGDDFRTVGGDYYSVAAEDYEANCEKARQLLAEAGYPDGAGFPAVEYLYNTNDGHKAIGEALQQMWQTELGITVSLGNQDWAVFLQNRKDGNYQIARNGWIADYNDPCSFLDMWYTDGGNNDAQYSNPEYDALIDAAKATAVAEDRMDAFHKAEDILIGQDKVLAPIYFYTQKYMLDPTIQGMYYTPLGYFFFGYTSKTA
ncbi:MAG: peptide ABC transporter substrate-binding protein [Oscillospiraceae bacterium]|jgi:oligopeptide transport system substrate-binding protein|nr:peptide ABC transporter substrate-binding protein [Oscillospiraceae bacterium]